MPNDDRPVPITSLDYVAGGALAERFSHALVEAIMNIRDLNTKANKPRKIGITVTLTPEDDREKVSVGFEVKTTLLPRRAVITEMLVGVDENGEIVAREITKQIPGQIGIDGKETTPRVARLTTIK